MSITSVILRFLAIYPALLIGAGFLLNAFDIKSGSGLNIGILAASVMLVCSSFAKKNNRYFSSGEKAVVISAMIAINLVLQLFFGWAAIANSQNQAVSFSVLWGSILLVGTLHSIAIAVFVSLVKRGLVKKGVVPG